MFYALYTSNAIYGGSEHSFVVGRENQSFPPQVTYDGRTYRYTRKFQVSTNKIDDFEKYCVLMKYDTDIEINF